MKLTSHAKQRMREMGVDADEVYAVLRSPEIEYVSDRHWALGDRRVVVGGRLALICERTRIVTVLWHLPNGGEWDRETERFYDRATARLIRPGADDG